MSTLGGLAGNWGSLSMTTLRGGGGSRLPDMVITFWPSRGGAGGGSSRNTNGSGVRGTTGRCRMMRGGAGGAALPTPHSSTMTMSPGAGGVGGRR